MLTSKLGRAQADELVRHPKVLFLLDGYDELSGSGSARDNLHRTLQVADQCPQAKLIVTCRTHHLNQEARGQVFCVPGQSSSVVQRFLVPFSQHNIAEYIQKRVADDRRPHVRPLLPPSEYLEELKASRSLRELVRAPFVLRLFVEALPRLREHHHAVTLFSIYSAFVAQWYENEVTRGTTKHLQGGERLNLSEFCKYAEQLAWQMYVQDTLVVRPPSDDGSPTTHDAAYRVYLRLEQTVLESARAEQEALLLQARELSIRERRALEAAHERCETLCVRAWAWRTH
mgnify:CR=1 FL=1